MKKNFYFIITALAIIILFFIYLIMSNKMKKTPQSQPTQTYEPILIDSSFIAPVSSVSSTFTDISFDGEPTSFSITQLPILNIQTTNHLNEIYPNLVDYCQMTNSEEDKYFAGNTCDFTLYENGDSPQVILNNQIRTSKTINVDYAKLIVDSFLHSTHAPNTPSLVLTNTSNLEEGEGNGEFEYSPNPSAANAVWLFYAFDHHGIPIIPHDDRGTYLSFIVNAENQLLKAELKSNRPSVLSTSEEYGIISIDQALSNIANDKAYLSQYIMYGDLEDETVLEKFSSVVFDEVRLEYRLNKEATEAMPSYHFYGTGYDMGDEPMGLEVVTPAINFTIAEPTPAPTP